MTRPKKHGSRGRIRRRLAKNASKPANVNRLELVLHSTPPLRTYCGAAESNFAPLGGPLAARNGADNKMFLRPSPFAFVVSTGAIWAISTDGTVSSLKSQAQGSEGQMDGFTRHDDDGLTFCTVQIVPKRPAHAAAKPFSHALC